MHTRRLTRTWRTSIALVGGALWLAGAAHAQDTELGLYRATIAELAGPSDVDITDDMIIVAELDADRIRVFGADGTPRDAMDAPLPVAVAADEATGRIVALSGLGEVLLFEAGDLVRRFPVDEQGRSRPGGVDIRGDRIAVADTGSDRVHVFSLTGTRLLTFGTRGDELGEFRRPADVAIDAAGRLYVVDQDNHRIQVFDSDGQALFEWGDLGAFPGLFARPAGVELHGDRVIVADALNHRIQVFTPDGEWVHQWGQHAVVPREGEGKLHLPNGVAVSPDGSYAVVVETFEARAQRFDRASLVDLMVPPIGADTSQDFGQVFATSDDLLAVWAPERAAAMIFDTRRATPILISEVSRPGPGYGLSQAAASITFDDDRRLTVCDPGTDRVNTYYVGFDRSQPLRFDTRISRFVKALEGRRLAAMAGVDELRITCAVRAPDGTRYLLDRDARRLVRLAPDLGEARVIGEGLDLVHPVHLAISASGDRLYIADHWASAVIAIDGDGMERWRWTGDADEPLERPRGVTAAPDGSIYVVDESTSRVHHLSAAGARLLSWGERGGDHGAFWRPTGVAIDGQDRVFVLDYGNHRAQIFDAAGEWLITFGPGSAYTRESEARRRQREAERPTP
ncbi:MAG: hypothetical protein F6K11_00290 [Leptolyngbya sp. SIO3F4]|nr:hypothetical protein [Leptolyngbya sp. SIO3F4]